MCFAAKRCTVSARVLTDFVATPPAPPLACRGRWRPALWEYPPTEILDVSIMPVLATDAARDLSLLRLRNEPKEAAPMIGAGGPVKMSLALMFFAQGGLVETATKRCAG